MRDHRRKGIRKKHYLRTMGILMASMMILSAGTSQLALAGEEKAPTEAVDEKEEKMVVYLNGKSGKDSRSGESQEEAVSSFRKAAELAGDYGVIRICGTVTVKGDQTWSLPSGVSVRRADGFEGPLVKVTGSLILDNVRIYTEDITGDGTVEGAVEKEKVSTPKSLTVDEPAALSEIPLTKCDGDGVFAWEDEDFTLSEYETVCKVIFHPYDTDAVDYSEEKGWDEEEEVVVRKITVYVDLLKPEETEEEDGTESTPEPTQEAASEEEPGSTPEPTPENTPAAGNISSDGADDQSSPDPAAANITSPDREANNKVTTNNNTVTNNNAAANNTPANNTPADNNAPVNNTPANDNTSSDNTGSGAAVPDSASANNPVSDNASPNPAVPDAPAGSDSSDAGSENGDSAATVVPETTPGADSGDGTAVPEVTPEAGDSSNPDTPQESLTEEEKAAAEEVRNLIDYLPTEVDSHEVVEAIVDASKWYESLTEEQRELFGEDTYKKLTEAQEKAAVYNRQCNGVKIEAELPWYVQFQVELNNDKSDVSVLQEKNVDTFIAPYDMKLWDMMNDEEYQLNGQQVRITIPAPDSAVYTQLVVVHYLEDGSVEYITPIYNDDGTISFVTTSFSPYNVAGSKVLVGNTDKLYNGSVNTSKLTGGSSSSGSSGSSSAGNKSSGKSSSGSKSSGTASSSKTNKSGSSSASGTSSRTSLSWIPRTGDDQPILFHIVVGVVVLAAMVIIVFGKKRKR